MLKLGRVTKVKVLFLVMVIVFNFDLFKFSAAILEKGLLKQALKGHSQLWDRADLETSFLTLKSSPQPEIKSTSKLPLQYSQCFS